MQCYTPNHIQTNSLEWITVPCQKCNFCLQNRRQDWAFRLMQETKVAKTAHFLTLTYRPEDIPIATDEDDWPIGFTLRKKDLFTFHQTIKRAQKRYLSKMYQDYKIRYYSVGEYGSKTKRPHYHLIIFNIHPEILTQLANGRFWEKGWIHIGDVKAESCSYVAKYLIDKSPLMEGLEKQFTCMSRNPGIGHNYIESHSKWHRNRKGKDLRMYTEVNGKKGRLPRYYKDRIFTKMDRALWAQIGAAMASNAYDREIEEIMKTHTNPVEIYEQRLKHHHDNIRIKSLKLNKF